LFVHDELKWNVEYKMSKDESKSFLLKTGKKWQSLSEEEREKLKLRYKKQREELKQRVKSYLQARVHLEMNEEELHKRISELVRDKCRRIQFNFKSKGDSDDEQRVAYVHDDLLLIHSDITKVDIKESQSDQSTMSSISFTLNQAGLEDKEESIKDVKRKLNLGTENNLKKAKTK